MLLAALFASPSTATAATGLEYTVLTPPGYSGSDRSYPVVYIVPGSGTGSAAGIEALRLREYAARDEAIVVVASEVGDAKSNFIVDWFDGSKPLDTSFTRELIPEVDATYRTMPDGCHRAIAGYSAGGYSAAAVASRHPELFQSVAAFSGTVDLGWRGPAGELAFEGGNTLFYGPDGAFRRWGDPLTEGANWDAQNPASLAARLRSERGVYIAAGDGTPATTDEAIAAGPYALQQGPAEAIAGDMTRSYAEKLTAAGVEHVYRPHAGLHRTSHWREDLAIWWPLAIDAMRAKARPQGSDKRVVCRRERQKRGRGRS